MLYICIVLLVTLYVKALASHLHNGFFFPPPPLYKLQIQTCGYNVLAPLILLKCLCARLLMQNSSEMPRRFVTRKYYFSKSELQEFLNYF